MELGCGERTRGTEHQLSVPALNSKMCSPRATSQANKRQNQGCTDDDSDDKKVQCVLQRVNTDSIIIIRILLCVPSGPILDLAPHKHISLHRAVTVCIQYYEEIPAEAGTNQFLAVGFTSPVRLSKTLSVLTGAMMCSLITTAVVEPVDHRLLPMTN